MGCAFGGNAHLIRVVGDVRNNRGTRGLQLFAEGIIEQAASLDDEAAWIPFRA
jgi:hypothetical protein